MTWIAEHWIVCLMLAAYTGLIAHHALLGKRQTKAAEDYFVGGRSMGGFILGLSFFATYSSTNSFIGMAGKSYEYGAPWLLLAPFAVVFSVLAWLCVAPRLRKFTAQLDSVTIPDFIAFRFSSEAARLAAAAIVIFASLLYMTAVFKGIGNLLEMFLGLPYRVAIAVVFVIVVAYTAVGGFISVVKTDAVQAVVMIAAGVILFVGVLQAAGGIDAVLKMPDLDETAHLFSWDGAMALPVLLGILVAGTMKLMVEPRQLSRFYALKDDAAARRGMFVSTAAFLLVYSLLAPIGLLAWRILPGNIEDSDLIVPTLLSDTQVFPAFVGAFLMVAMVAAAMSSLDSVLLVTATTVERDVLRGLRRRRAVDERRELRNTRILVALLALVTAVIALDPPGQIVTLTTFSGSLFAACFFPPIVLGLHWRRGNGTAVLASFVTGIGTLLLWGQTPFASDVHKVFPAMAVSISTYVALARMMSTPVNPQVDALFVMHRRP